MIHVERHVQKLNTKINCMFLNLITFNNVNERKVKVATKDVQMKKFYYLL
jgi:hypothetical protein